VLTVYAVADTLEATVSCGSYLRTLCEGGLLWLGEALFAQILDKNGGRVAGKQSC
jgi:hypothetical protein